MTELKDVSDSVAVEVFDSILKLAHESYFTQGEREEELIEDAIREIQEIVWKRRGELRHARVFYGEIPEISDSQKLTIDYNSNEILVAGEEALNQRSSNTTMLEMGYNSFDFRQTVSVEGRGDIRRALQSSERGILTINLESGRLGYYFE